ncbi:MAG: radical SAM protein, partial [Oscillospiraceae bacterium]|nr:radical SAM protein [Oscillospiraceae bacterium]
MNNESYRELIDAAAEKCLAGTVLSVKETEALLDIPIGSAADEYLQKTARRVSSELTGDRGYLWCAVGMDYAPCTMNCRFCSFGEAWGLVKKPRHVTEEEIISHVRTFAEGGAAYIILRTTEFYSLDTLLDYVPRIRAAVPGDYQLVLNTGELDAVTAERCASAGIYGVYHALRLGEGVTTPFAPEQRIATMQSVGESPMTLVSLVEPVGEEHSNAEIAQRFADIIACGAEISGVMARFPVKGTPLGDEPMISEDRMAHIAAALRLSGGRAVRDICAHPATEKIVAAG